MAGSIQYDVAVIGAGIGGYVSAIRAAQLGKKVALIEEDRLGGTCLNWGCIPTVTILATADLIGQARRAEEFGLHLGEVTVDLEKVMGRKDAVVNRLADGIQFLMRKNGIHVLRGKGRILSKNEVHISRSDGGEEVTDAENIIIATGSEEPKPSYATIDEERILTSRGALNLKESPESLAIIGGNIIGIEFAVIFNSFGAEVKILESAPNLLPTLDKDIGRSYQRILKKKGIELYLNTEVISAKVRQNGKVGISAVAGGSELDIETEKVLITEGRRPRSAGLGLEEIGVQVQDGSIVVDEHMRTSVPNIYAVGDVAGGEMLAHVAAAGGVVAAENIAELETTISHRAVPTCMYCQPEVASVGLSQDEAEAEGYKVSVGKFSLLGNGRASALGEADGFAKVICDRETGEILGVHLVAPHATDLIGEAALAMVLECTSEEIGSLIHAHPTIGEALMEAAKAVSKKAIHM